MWFSSPLRLASSASRWNLVALSSARKRISLLSTVNNLSTAGENCGYRQSPSQQTPPGTPLRREILIQGQVLPSLINTLSDCTGSSLIKDFKTDIRDTISTCVHVYLHAYWEYMICNIWYIGNIWYTLPSIGPGDTELCLHWATRLSDS